MAGRVPRKLLFPAISVDGKAEFRVNFGTQPFHCSDFQPMLHGCGSMMCDPKGNEEIKDMMARTEQMRQTAEQEGMEKVLALTLTLALTLASVSSLRLTDCHCCGDGQYVEALMLEEDRRRIEQEKAYFAKSQK